MKTPIQSVLLGFGFVALRAVLVAWIVAAQIAKLGVAMEKTAEAEFLDCLLWLAWAAFAVAVWQAVPWRRLWRRWMGWALMWIAIAAIVFVVGMAVYEHNANKAAYEQRRKDEAMKPNAMGYRIWPQHDVNGKEIWPWTNAAR